MQIVSLIAPKPYPTANPLQIFKGNSSVGAFGNINNLLADNMVSVFGKALLFAGNLFKSAFGGVSAFGLQPFALSSAPFSKARNVRSAVPIAVRINSDILNAEVNPQNIFNVSGGWFVNLARSKQVKRAIYQAQVTFALLGFEQFVLTFAAFVWQVFNPAANRPNGNTSFFCVPSQNAKVIGDRAKRLKGTLNFFIQLVSVRNLSYATNNDLRGKVRVRFPDVVVSQLVDTKLTKDPCAPCCCANIVTQGCSVLRNIEKQGFLW